MSVDSDMPHVLVVDDNQDAAEVLALLIEADDCSAATARSLAQAREEVLRQLPRLVFLDLNLPDGNGMDLLAEMKADQKTADVDVVMLTGMMNERVREEAHLLGAAAFVLKPLGQEQLTALLDSVR